MNLWRLELLRMTRTHRWTILVGVYVLFGVLGPFTGRYLGDLVARFAGDVVMQIPDPRPVDGIVQFLSNTSQIGLIVLVIVAASALAIDARQEVAAFLRTRVAHARQLLWPRYLVVVGTAAVALVAGTAVAWILTGVLTGPLPVAAMLVGTAYALVYLVFVVALLAALAAATGGTMPTALGGLAVLLVLPVISLLPPVEPWLPSHLVGAIAAMIEGAAASEFLRATLVSVVATVSLLAVAARSLERREL